MVNAAIFFALVLIFLFTLFVAIRNHLRIEYFKRIIISQTDVFLSPQSHFGPSKTAEWYYLLSLRERYCKAGGVVRRFDGGLQLYMLGMLSRVDSVGELFSTFNNFEDSHMLEVFQSFFNITTAHDKLVELFDQGFEKIESKGFLEAFVVRLKHPVFAKSELYPLFYDRITNARKSFA